MNPTFTRHARQQMARRAITEADVQGVLRRPIGSALPGSRPDTVVLVGVGRGGSRLKVVVDSADWNTVVTTYWEGSQP